MVDAAVDQVRGVEVGAVAQTREAGDSEALFGEVLGQVDRDVAALGDDRHRARTEFVDRRVEAGGVVEHAQAVRAEHRDSGVPKPGDQGVLACQPICTGFPQPGGDRDDRLDAAVMASSTASSNPAAGTAMTARSTGPSSEVRLGAAG